MGEAARKLAMGAGLAIAGAGAVLAGLAVGGCWLADPGWLIGGASTGRLL